MDQEAFLRGRRAGASALAAWRKFGYQSPEHCRRRLRVDMQSELCNARFTLRQGHSQVMEQHVSYCLGFLSSLK